jgi:uncharacterized protein (DUF1778 family)
MTIATQILSVRVNEGERRLLEQAAAQARTSLSDFVRRRSVEAAELDVMDRRVIAIPAADWDRFEAWASAPARDIEGLRELAAHLPSWRD